MSKELFELMMKEINAQAKEVQYTTGAAAGEFMATVFYTIENEFFKQLKEGKETAPKDLHDFNHYFNMQKRWLSVRKDLKHYE